MLRGCRNDRAVCRRRRHKRKQHDAKDQWSGSSHRIRISVHHVATVAAERQASAGARDGVKGKGAISLRALRCMR